MNNFKFLFLVILCKISMNFYKSIVERRPHLSGAAPTCSAAHPIKVGFLDIIWLILGEIVMDFYKSIVERRPHISGADPKCSAAHPSKVGFLTVPNTTVQVLERLNAQGPSACPFPLCNITISWERVSILKYTFVPPFVVVKCKWTCGEIFYASMPKNTKLKQIFTFNKKYKTKTNFYFQQKNTKLKQIFTFKVVQSLAAIGC